MDIYIDGIFIFIYLKGRNENYHLFPAPGSGCESDIFNPYDKNLQTSQTLSGNFESSSTLISSSTFSTSPGSRSGRTINNSHRVQYASPSLRY